MVVWSSIAFADVEDVVASDEDLAQLALALPVYHLLCVSQLRGKRDTRRFMYSSLDWRMPRNYQPHFSITLITLPWRSWRKGSGFYICSCVREWVRRSTWVATLIIICMDGCEGRLLVWSFFEHHVPPVDVVDVAFLVGDSGEGVWICHPKYLGHFLS